MADKTIFWYWVIMLIYANYRENDGVDLKKKNASKEAYTIIRQYRGLAASAMRKIKR